MNRLFSSRGNCLALTLLAFALLSRVLVPAGWMPTAADGWKITLCTGMGVVEAWVDEDGNLRKDAPSGGKSDSHQPCIFSGFGAAIDMPPVFASVLSATLPMHVALFRKLTVSIGNGLAAPPPPQTGPPLI